METGNNASQSLTC